MNSMRQVGGSIGVALIGAIIAAKVGDRRSPEAFVDGFSTALVVASGFAFVGAIVAAVTVRKVRHEAPVPLVEPALTGRDLPEKGPEKEKPPGLRPPGGFSCLRLDPPGATSRWS